MEKMTSILSAYEREEPRRARGGIYALAGFDYQLRLYLAEFAEALASEGKPLEKAGELFLEALSDLTKQTVDDHLVCIQVKRTLTGAALKDAATEVEAIERFLKAQYPDRCDRMTFELVASQGDAALQWSHLPATHSAYSTIDVLLQQGRLLPPRIEPDPWWRAITVVWKHLQDPYGFLRFALDRALSRAPTAADAQRIRDDICERFAQARQTHDLPGQLLTLADFERTSHPSSSLDIGREITLPRLRDQQYMSRGCRLDALYSKLLEHKDLSLRDLRSEARVFWLSGRSGVGKSVLLLQTVERLVTEGWRVLWLKGQAELLEPALRVIANSPAEWWPDFIAIDDLYDRDARTRLDLGRLGDFIDDRGRQSWPMILTCGPTEFADAFSEATLYRGFELHRETVETIAASEAGEIEAWYRERTGQESRRGAAFAQASQNDEGLFISLAVELAHGDLQAFAQRFGERVRFNRLDEALRLPLALNRLYLRAPYDWLNENDREKLATLNGDGDFSLLETAMEGHIVRLTHPHLADALYRALRKPSNTEAYTNDLVAVFRRALAERDVSLISRLLRVFSTRDEGLTSERLSIIDLSRLARECARAWTDGHTQLELDADGLADIATSWACWATTAPGLIEFFGARLLGEALAHLGAAYKAWSACWRRLVGSYPKREELFSWATEHLADPKKITHPTWSFAWELCLQHDPSSHTAWRDMGLDWLQHHLRRPDWHFVWKKLLPDDGAPDWKTDPVLILGLRRLHTEKDGPNWAFVFQDLYALAASRCPLAGDLATLAQTWLLGREDRAEWTYVWRALLAQGESLPDNILLAELLGMGAAWLAGREDRVEWSYIWRALLAQSESLPDNMPLAELLGMGAAWLSGREDQAEWARVWQALLEQGDSSPDSMTLAELLETGAAWLPGREDRAEWARVWQQLLAHHNVLPDSIQLAELQGTGAAWLPGREDRAEWNYVWRALLAQGGFLPVSMPLAELLGMGAVWLPGREDRAEWTHVWQDLLAQGDFLPVSMPLAELLGMGAAWLPGREDRAEWAHVWQDLLAHANVQPDSLPLAELLRLGSSWLAGHEGTEWGFVCEALLEQQFQDHDFIEQAAAWLKCTDAKPEWSLLSAKFIVANPRHAASADFAQILVERIKASPNNGHWFKTVDLVSNLTDDIELSCEVRDWLQTLHARRKAPAWAEARRRMDEGSPVEGRVTVIKANACGVELDIGLVAVWPNSRDGVRRFKGLERSFFVQKLNPDKDFVGVGINKPGSLEDKLAVGSSYDGLVTGVTELGVFVRIGAHSGLLHCSQLPSNTNIQVRYAVGQSLRVQVIKVRIDGKLALSLPTH